MKIIIITAANGNATAIGIISENKNRKWYEEKGNNIMEDMRNYNVEQVGFLIVNSNHFEMSGGEFCGNAARSAAMIFSKLQDKKELEFTMSGYKGFVSATIEWRSKTQANVSCVFTDLPLKSTSVVLDNNVKATMVDMGGIIHVIINGKFPIDYESQHYSLMKKLGLENKDAVGVDWISNQNNNVVIHPVVWVKSINTFFYESSCGSGSIAASVVTNKSNVVQPSGKVISVSITDNLTALKSDMEIIHEQ